MLHHTPKDNPDLFGQEKTRCATELPAKEEVRFQRLRTMNPLNLLSSIMHIVLGLAIIVLSMIGLIAPLSVAAIMSMLGSAAVIIGGYQLYDAIKERNSVQKLARDSVERIIKEQN